MKVSVVTPFYNTERYLEDCIRSVLGQSYGDFEYILVDNCSTDSSRDIAARHAGLDSRIRLVRNSEFLDQVSNYNHALAQVSTESDYCKIVQADDWIAPRCLEELVRVAETDPSIGIVSSYRFVGSAIGGTGLPPPGAGCATVLTGHQTCRLQLLQGRFFFGSPTTVLYRAQIVRSRRPFFSAGRLHEDTEACYEILKDWKFGFAHEVLSFSRTDNESIMTRARRYNATVLESLINSRLYGPYYLTPDEFKAHWKAYERAYIRFLAKSILGLQTADFWKYHRRGMRTIGYRPPPGRLIGALGAVLMDALLNPKTTVERGIAAIKSRALTRLRSPSAH